MGMKRKQMVALAASAVVAVGIAGCGGGDTDSGGGAGNQEASGDVTTGGTVRFLQLSGSEHLDPQRMYIGRDLSNFGRLVYRSLVTFPGGLPMDQPEEAQTPVADLATDTGTANEDATQWQFTIKDGVTWQDGSDITCEDFAYGVSRTFATDVITGGPNYIQNYLDLPLNADGVPTYNGPYKGDGQADFDKAITCDGNTITYNFRKPWPDFPLAIASLRAFDPYKESEDEGEQSNLKVFSNGPYMLDGDYSLDSGGTFVRNPEWDQSTDDVRKAYPDSFVFEAGVEPEIINERLIADSGDDTTAITTTSVTPPQYGQITGPVEDRASLVESPFTNYLLPNFNRIKNADVRKALAMATDRAAYSQALGGDNASTPATSIVNPAVPGYTESDAFGDAEGGDFEGAKQLLSDAGEEGYPITLTFPKGSDASDNAFAALGEGYKQAGFKVTLEGLDPSGPYYDTIQKPGSSSDLIWGGWGADWPSISTVIPPLFDSRINLTASSNGQDYGNYASPDVNKLIDEAGAETDLDAANDIYGQINDQLAEDTAYIPLDTTSFYFLHGSGIANYVQSPATSGYPDLSVIAVDEG